MPCMENFGSDPGAADVFVGACVPASDGVDKPITLLFAVSPTPFASPGIGLHTSRMSKGCWRLLPQVRVTETGDLLSS